MVMVDDYVGLMGFDNQLYIYIDIWFPHRLQGFGVEKRPKILDIYYMIASIQ